MRGRSRLRLISILSELGSDGRSWRRSSVEVLLRKCQEPRGTQVIASAVQRPAVEAYCSVLLMSRCARSIWASHGSIGQPHSGEESVGWLSIRSLSPTWLRDRSIFANAYRIQTGRNHYRWSLPMLVGPVRESSSSTKNGRCGSLAAGIFQRAECTNNYRCRSRPTYDPLAAIDTSDARVPA
jgi:hypothetical protein